MTRPDIEELRRLLQAGTPAPWSVHDHDGLWGTLIQGGAAKYGTDCDIFDGSVAVEEDASLIVAMRNALPALLDRLDACERVVIALADNEPCAISDETGYWECVLCRASPRTDRSDEHVVHNSDCAWLEARRLKGETP